MDAGLDKSFLLWCIIIKGFYDPAKAIAEAERQLIATYFVIPRFII